MVAVFMKYVLDDQFANVEDERHLSKSSVSDGGSRCVIAAFVVIVNIIVS